MKRVFPKLLIAACLSLMVSHAPAEPAFVSMLSNCQVGWVSAEPLEPEFLPNIVFIRGSGVEVVPNNGLGYTQFHCKTRLDFSQPVPALNFFTLEPVVVMLASFSQACAEVGFCPRGNHGAVVLDGSIGLPCQTALGPTFDWHAVIAPSGQTKIVCKMHEPQD